MRSFNTILGYGALILSTTVTLDITHYKGLYQVSNLGRVRSLHRVTLRDYHLKGLVLAYNLAGAGYLQVGHTREH